MIDFTNSGEIVNILSVISAVFTIVSMIYYFIKYLKSIKNFSWRKVKKGIKELEKTVTTKVKPDIIISLSGRGGIVVNLLINELGNGYPVFTCILKNKLNDSFLEPEGWIKMSTSKWQIYMPSDILQMKGKRILIIDDITSSGETILLIKKVLEINGIDADNIFSMALVADKETQKFKHIPDYYWKIVDIDKYNVPWGKTVINNYK